MKYAMKHVYIIKSGRYYKIGITHDLQQRLFGLRVDSPLEVELVLSAESDRSEEVESQLHEMFKEKLVRGEWYLLKKADIELARSKIFPEATTTTSFRHQCVSMREFQRNMYNYLDLAKQHPITITKRDVPTYMIHTPQQAGSVASVAKMWGVSYPSGVLEAEDVPLKLTKIRESAKHGPYSHDRYEKYDKNQD